MDEIQACILNFRFAKLQEFIKERQLNAKYYMKFLDKKNVYFPLTRDYAGDSFHTFVIQVDQRDDLKQYLLKNGIETSIHYPTPIHLQSSSAYLGFKENDFPKTEKQSKRILTLPVNNYITDSEIMYICEKVNKFFN